MFMEYRHHDVFGRVHKVSRREATIEQTLDPADGRLVPLTVQQANETPSRPDAIAWNRNGALQMRISPALRLVYWLYSSVLEEEANGERNQGDSGTTLALCFKWVPTCVVLVLMLFIPQMIERKTRNNGYYDPVRYRDWRYAKAPRNRHEAQPPTTEEGNGDDNRLGEHLPLLSAGNDLEMTDLSSQPRMDPEQASENLQDLANNHDLDQDRGLGPRYLCYLTQLEDSSSQPTTGTYTAKKVDADSGPANTEFVFVSYTRMQFVVDTPADLARQAWLTQPEREARARLSPLHRAALLEFGIAAARAAGKRAFWIDFECIRDTRGVAETNSQSYDVYRICDIVRAAHSLVIVAGPSIEDQIKPGPALGPNLTGYWEQHMTAWLREYGTRLWTLPEILLCSNEHRIRLYAVGRPGPPEEVAKRNFPARAALKDAHLVRELIDHYESSIHLSPLELASLALECFSERQTNHFNPGDKAYALMGLLRRRPVVDRTDTDFEAFARLSLANDSDALLERLLCMQPETPDAKWFHIRDAWGVALWDITPTCHVAAVVDDQTVTLDGVFGAHIQWDRIEPVAFFKRRTFWRAFAKVVLRGAPFLLLSGLAMLIAAYSLSSDFNQLGDSDVMLTPGLATFIPAALIMLVSPALLLHLYAGKFYGTQALFIGMEGIPSELGTVERYLFGFNFGRLKWAAAGSTLSRHKLSHDGECEALPPIHSTDFDDDLVTFTLVDTYSLTATAFRAARPPTALMIAGQEGGMQRAVLCSYDARRATFAREAVVRVRTTVLDRLFRVESFRFALRRGEEQAWV